MFEDKNMNGPKKCINCESENLIGPYDVPRGRIFFGFIKSVGRVAFICSDCFYTMYFIRKNDRENVRKEAQKVLYRY